jgi:hypothetical protein
MFHTVRDPYQLATWSRPNRNPETVYLDTHPRPHFLQARVSCNCKKACDMQHCFKNDSKCSVYCHKSDEHNCSNLKPLSERTEISLLPRESLQDVDSDSSDSNIGNEIHPLLNLPGWHPLPVQYRVYAVAPYV